MVNKKLFWLLAAIAQVLGILIAYIDSRPGWDDTGITALVVLMVTGLLGVAAPSHAWLWALAVGAWIPLVGILAHQNYGSLMALLIAFIGAYAGALLRKLIASTRPNHQNHQS